MAHDIYRDASGRDAMWCVGNREAAWHLLGQRTDQAQNWEAAMKLAGLDWAVGKYQLVGAAGDRAYAPVPAWGMFRESDGAFLGAVGKDYTPIQNRDAFDWIDTLLESENGFHYESAGALGNGSQIWVMANIGQEIGIRGTDDISRMYLLFGTSHDGSSAATAKITAERVVCRNTYNAAMNSAGAIMRIRHTTEAADRLARAKKLMSSTLQDVKSLEEKFNLLAQRRMTRETMISVLDRIFPLEAEATKLREERRNKLVVEVLKLYELNDGNAIPEIRGTAWNMFNAVTEWTDHFREVSNVQGMSKEQVRAKAAMFGVGDKTKQDALSALLDLTQNAPASQLSRSYSVGTAVAEPAVEVPHATPQAADVAPELQSDIDREVERMLRNSGL